MNCPGKSKIACLLKVIATLVVVVALLYGLESWFPYLFYLRVPLLSGALLLALPILCLFVLSSMLANLFVLDGKWHLAFVIWMAVLAGMGVVVMGGVIVANGDGRFHSAPPALLATLFAPGSLWAGLLSIVLALPTCYYAFRLFDVQAAGRKVRTLGAWMGLAGGALIFAAVEWFQTNNWSGWAEQKLVWLFQILPVQAESGFIVNGELAPGHGTAAAFLLVAGLLYITVFFLFRPLVSASAKEQKNAPALFYVLELVQVWSAVLSLLTFALDIYRLPVLLSLLAFSAFIYWICRVDHYYEIKPVANDSPIQADTLAALKERLDRWQGPDNRTLVVVCASGGGIQAAGWTSRVLTGLQDKFQAQDFTRKIGLISSVSGGSVGTLYFLDRFKGGQADPNQLNAIFNAATEDSLDATGWGLSYPDLWRFIGLPFLSALVKPTDRGAAINANWKTEMASPGETLQSWRGKVLAGELPIPVLNATLVESGEVYQLCPLDMAPANPELKGFASLFPQYDLDASTAALLSATFPYVTPIARNSNPSCDPKLPVYHVADGGYFDNFGVVSAVDWLENHVLPNASALGLSKVLIIEIRAFPDPKPIQPTEENSRPAGWLMAVLGPALAIVKTRNATQAQRNSEILDDLISKGSELGLAISRHPIPFPEKIPFYQFSLRDPKSWIAQAANALQNLQGWSATLVDQLGASAGAKAIAEAAEKKAYQPPLSWKLTREQKQAIENAWGGIENGPEVQGIEDALKR